MKLKPTEEDSLKNDTRSKFIKGPLSCYEERFYLCKTLSIRFSKNYFFSMPIYKREKEKIGMLKNKVHASKIVMVAFLFLCLNILSVKGS